MKSIKPDVPSKEIGMSCSGPAETYALITSVPATSQPICGGPEHPESHQDNTTDPTDTNSFIMSVNSIYQPSELPRVKVSPGVIRESSAVKISCETPADVIVYQCHFYINREEKKMKTSESCELELTGAEVLRWAAVKSPGSLDINCYYTTNKQGSVIASSDSDPATVTVLALVSTTTEQTITTIMKTKLPRVKVSPDVIRESSAVKISCETPADVIVYQCHFYINREEKKMKTSESCELELTGAEVLRWAAVKSPGSLDINCYYTTNERGSIITSSDSDPATVTVLALVSTTTEQTITTIMKTTHDYWSNTNYFASPHNALSTASTVMSTAKTTTYSKTDIWFIVLVSIGVTIILSGLIGLICLCRLISLLQVIAPTVKVSPYVIRESSSVKISCETPADVIVNQCYFNTNRDRKNIKDSPSFRADFNCGLYTEDDAVLYQRYGQ
ncbi:hypothetical protein ROHU_001172 [Labeo rohita]|uniref:Uncharacterized protein n=1 Tax=Labeo rohita TaxID=84645 RepID=A0A498P2D6_LABRO|nr:hypothetical protein ROHU_001172 [Labeo rohita]